MKSSKFFESVKSKGGLMFALLFMMLIGAGTMMAMKGPEADKAKRLDTQTWYYQLNSMKAEDLNNPANYQLSPKEGTVCGFGTIVCSIVDVPNPANNAVPALANGDVLQNESTYHTAFRDID